MPACHRRHAGCARAAWPAMAVLQGHVCGGGWGRSAAAALSHLPVIEALPLALARERCDGGSMNYLCEVDHLDVPVLIGGQEQARPLTTGMKLMLIVASTLVFLVGIQL